MWSPLLGLIILICYIGALTHTIVDIWTDEKEGN